MIITIYKSIKNIGDKLLFILHRFFYFYLSALLDGSPGTYYSVYESGAKQHIEKLD